MADCFPYMEDYYVPPKNINDMTNKEKAEIYDNLLRENDILTRKISHLKSEYAPNIPTHIEEEIKKLEYNVSLVVGKLENLFKA